MDDAELVKRVIAGDKKLFAALVEKYSDTLSSLAFLITRNSADAHDVVQQALFTAYCKLGDIADPVQFGRWLRGIVSKLARKIVAEQERRRKSVARLARAQFALDPADQLADEEKRSEILRAVDTLDKRTREVVALHYLRGLRLEEIGLLLGIPVGSVKRILSEGRELLRKELIQMAREEFKEYTLSREERERLAKVAEFPRREPKIAVVPTGEKAKRVRTAGFYGSFAALEPGAEACFADYDHPGGNLTAVSHVRREGPVKVKGKVAFTSDCIAFSAEGKKVEGVFRPYYRLLKGDRYLYCAKQFCSGRPTGRMPVLTPEHPDWNEPKPKSESLLIVPGSRREPCGDWNGFIVDTNLRKVKIGKRNFICLRRSMGGAKRAADWTDLPVTTVATEEFFLEDGRLLLWRRYNGLQWSENAPRMRKKSSGVYERLKEAGVPSLEIFGERYYLWYDQIPDYALSRA
jgi:RNA polymerase sigma-70 factor (ECF subfamily)